MPISYTSFEVSLGGILCFCYPSKSPMCHLLA
jgi:hypothetical protein